MLIPTGRRVLTPDHFLGCMRLLRSNDWYPAPDRDDVTVVGAGVTAVEIDAVVDAEGRRHPADVVVLGTGFRATGFLSTLDGQLAGPDDDLPPSYPSPSAAGLLASRLSAQAAHAR